MSTGLLPCLVPPACVCVLILFICGKPSLLLYCSGFISNFFHCNTAFFFVDSLSELKAAFLSSKLVELFRFSTESKSLWLVLCPSIINKTHNLFKLSFMPNFDCIATMLIEMVCIAIMPIGCYGNVTNERYVSNHHIIENERRRRTK